MKSKLHDLFIIHALVALALNFADFQQAKAVAYAFIPTGSMNVPREYHTATLLPNGQVLVAGGQVITNSITLATATLASAELYNPVTGTWTMTGPMNNTRSLFTSVLLPNGKVLVVGGDASSASAELYNPATGTWTMTGPMNTARSEFTATLLPNGNVLAAGGYFSYSLTNAEVYNPATGTWTMTGPMNYPRYGNTATLLPNGKVLVAGVADTSHGYGQTADLYDPASGTWTLTGTMNAVHRNHTANLLANGKVLVAGGNGGAGSLILSAAELYDPTTGTWSVTGSLNYPRENFTTTLLPSGQVLAAGGYELLADGLSSAELYDPVGGAWTQTNSLHDARQGHTATLLPSGQVLLAGGEQNPNTIYSNVDFTLNSAELFVPMTGSLEVTLDPTGAISAGAQWQVDGGALQNSGAVVNNLPVGNHTISFSTVTGWLTPGDQTVTVAFGVTTNVSSTYLPNKGSLQVTLGPSGAVSAGAQWQVDGGPFQNSGAVVNNLLTGNHTVSFNTITGWFTPVNQLVTVGLNVTNTYSVTYLPNIGALQVTITPVCAVENGAQWQVDGGVFQNSGAVVTNLAGGNHIISFTNIVGWLAPSNLTVLVTAATTNTTAGNYTEVSIPGTITWIHNGGNLNWNNPANWDLNRAPVSSDIVLIPFTQGTNCQLDVDTSVAGLVIGDCPGGGSDGLNLNGHSLTVNGPLTIKSNAVFGVNSGTLIGNSNAIISGVIGWTSGTLGGTLTLASNCVLNLSATTYNKNLNCVLTNYGAVNWSDDQLNGGGAGAVVFNYGLWNAQDNQTFGGAGTVFNNYGIFRKSGGASTYPGTLIQGGGPSGGGVLFNQAGGVLDVQNGTNGLQLDLQGGGNFTGGYVTTNSNGFTYLSFGNFNLNGTITCSNVVEGASLVGTNVIRGGLTWQNGNWNGTVTIVSNCVVNTSGTTFGKTFNGCLVTNYGTFNWSGDPLNGNSGAIIYNYGLWNASDNQYFNDATFNNYGTFLKSGGASGYPGTYFNRAAFNQAGGVLSVQTGDVTLGGACSVTNGTLNFGIINATNNGVILAGSVLLGGSLSVNVNANYTPAVGDVIGLIGASALTGTFSHVNAPAGMSVVYSGVGVSLNVSGPVPVQILNPQPVGTNLFFQFPTATNQSYTIQQNSNLATTNWTFFTNIVGSGSLFQFQTPISFTPAQRFFRVRQP